MLAKIIFTENLHHDHAILGYIEYSVLFFRWQEPSTINQAFMLRNCCGKRNFLQFINIRVSNIHSGFKNRIIEQPEPPSLPNLEIARKWIRECINTHKRYSIAHSNDQRDENRTNFPQLPTRVIDVVLGHN
jgi:hypothetical protein